MQPDPFTSDDLKLVNAIAEAGGLGGAAKRLGVNGSTVFRRLGALEARIGIKLFERRRGGYVTTPPGADMAGLAARLEDEIAGLSRRLASCSPTPSGEIRITTNDGLFGSLLLPIFARIRARYPAIRFNVLLSNAPLNLSRREADVAIRVTPSPPDTLVGRRVATIGWALYGRVGVVDPTQPFDPSAHDWVTLGEGLENVAAAQFVRRLAPSDRIALKVDTVPGMSAAVEAGIGIGPLPCFAGDACPGLVRIAPPDEELAGSLWLLTHQDLRHMPRIRAILDLLGEGIVKQRAALAGLPA